MDITFPVKSRAVRRFIIRTRDQCPECGGSLDTGWECNKCGFDARPEMTTDYSEEKPVIFAHFTPKDDCEHNFQGWRDFPEGNGGEQFCSKCGLGAMAHSLRHGP